VRFAKLRCTEESMGPLFACHKSPEGAEIPCAGWTEYQRGRHGHNVRVRLLALEVPYRVPRLIGEQFETYDEMAEAHAAARRNR
jgi:hypothetical protein